MEQQKISIKEIVELCKKYYAGKIDKEDLDSALKIMSKTYKKSPKYINPYYKI